MYSGTVLPLKEYFRGRRATEYGIRQDNQISLELGIIRAYKNAIEDILIIGRDSTLDKTRKKNIVEARFIIWYLIRKDFSGITLKKIGELIKTNKHRLSKFKRREYLWIRNK